MSDAATRTAAPLEEPMETLRRIPTLPLGERRELLETLLRDGSAGVRQRALAMAAVLLPEELLVSFLRREADDVLRNAGVEILKLRGPRSLPLAIRLLDDADPDVVLQALLVLDALREPSSKEPLRRALGHRDPNVRQAALLALGRLGDRGSFADVVPFLDDEPWLQMAAVRALGLLGSPRAVPRLERLLPDPLLGPLAAEALAQIGAPKALACLAGHWVELREEIESEPFLSRLAAAAATMHRPPTLPTGARESIAAELDSGSEAIRTSAARTILALGPGPGDERALDRLVEACDGSSHLPDCLERRDDLVPLLVERGGTPRLWGLRLAAKGRRHLPASVLLESLSDETDRIAIELAAPLLEHCRDEGVGGGLVEAFGRVPPDLRPLLGRAIRKRAAEIRKALAANRSLDEESRTAIEILVGAPAAELSRRLDAAAIDVRLRLLALALARPPLVRRLPWRKWLSEAPGEHAEAAAAAIQQAGSPELAGWLRERLAGEGEPEPSVIRAIGQIRDLESSSTLVGLLGRSENGRIRAQCLESLGQIGGDVARRALLEWALHSPTPEARIAWRSLAGCATEADSPFFRDAATHPDWVIRLSAVDALARTRAPEDWPALVSLSADPVAAVAHKAMACVAP